MAADATSLLLVILTVSPLALPETGGRSDSSIPLVAPNSLGSFDWSEDWRTLYDVKIGKEPISEERAKEDSQAPSMVIFSKHNQKYHCTLPRPLPAVEQEEEDTSPSLHGVSELLEPLKKSCFTKTVGWWTYEYCHGRHIQQYHMEGGRVSGATVSIGKYRNETDWSQFDDNLAKARRREGLVHQVDYINGDNCDVTGKPRQAVAKIHCSLSGNGLERVVEPAACVYVLTVSSTQLCMHPLFQSSAGKVREVIECSPVLNDKQYEQYRAKEGEGGRRMSSGAGGYSELSQGTTSSLRGRFDNVMQPSDTMNMLLSGYFSLFWEMLRSEDEDDEEEEVEEEGAEEGQQLSKAMRERMKSLVGKLGELKSSVSQLKEALAADDEESEKAGDVEETTPTDTPTKQIVDHGDNTDLPPTGDSDTQMTAGDSDAQVSEASDSNTWFTEDDSDEYTSEDGEDEARFFDVGGWRVRVSKPKMNYEGDEEEGESDSKESLRELQEKVSEELEEELATMGINADGRVKVKFVMVPQDDEDDEGQEDGEDYMGRVIRSLPDDTTSLVSSYLKDVLSGGKASQREQQKQAQLENNYNKVWSDAEQEEEVEGKEMEGGGEC